MTKTMILFVAIFLLVPVSTKAQSNFKFSSTFVIQDEPDDARLRPIWEMFNQKMISRNAEYSENEGTLFLIGASEPDENGNFALSIGVFSKLPENIVQSGKMGQVFYMAIEAGPIQMLSEEGTMVREELSEDYLRQFVMIVENEVIITNAKRLSRDMDNYIADYIKKYY